jgi:predicted HAD superfamily phosphohydrolase YqeG
MATVEQYYVAGRTLRTEKEFPNGVPCIIYDRDSVLCESRASNGMEEMIRWAQVMNMARAMSNAFD